MGGRTQRWLCSKANINEVLMSNAINGYCNFTEQEFNMVVEVLQFSAEEISDIINSGYVFRKNHKKQ